MEREGKRGSEREGERERGRGKEIERKKGDREGGHRIEEREENKAKGNIATTQHKGLQVRIYMYN